MLLPRVTRAPPGTLSNPVPNGEKPRAPTCVHTHTCVHIHVHTHKVPESSRGQLQHPVLSEGLRPGREGRGGPRCGSAVTAWPTATRAGTRCPSGPAVDRGCLRGRQVPESSPVPWDRDRGAGCACRGLLVWLPWLQCPPPTSRCAVCSAQTPLCPGQDGHGHWLPLPGTVLSPPRKGTLARPWRWSHSPKTQEHPVAGAGTWDLPPGPECPASHLLAQLRRDNARWHHCGLPPTPSRCWWGPEPWRRASQPGGAAQC